MSQIIFLDSTPVGLITNPKATPLAVQCQQWLDTLLSRNIRVILSEIIDYEVKFHAVAGAGNNTICSRANSAA